MTNHEDQDDLIKRYEQLRKKLKEIEAQAEQLEKELGRIESQLPDDYCYPDDEPPSSEPPSI
jgi:chaperonin cofactor prefoldin